MKYRLWVDEHFWVSSRLNDLVPNRKSNSIGCWSDRIAIEQIVLHIVHPQQLILSCKQAEILNSLCNAKHAGHNIFLNI